MKKTLDQILTSSFKWITLFFGLLAAFAFALALWLPLKVDLESNSPIAGDRSPDFGVNYFAQGKLWQDFWIQFDQEEVERDFRLIKDLDLRVVRIFLYQEYFASRETHQDALTKLGIILDLAEKHQLKLIVTLFDWSKPYQFEIGKSSESMNFKLGAEDVIERFHRHNAIYSWDLKNEPDHDFVSDGRDIVSNWLNDSYLHLKSKWPLSRFTVGWLWIFEDLKINTSLDFLSFHHFPEQGSLVDRIDRFKNSFPHKPIMLEEVGYSTYFKAPSNQKTQERKQEQFIRNAFMKVLQNELAGGLIWSLKDHPEIGGPKRPPHENGFGLYRLDSSKKPAAELLTKGLFVGACKKDQFLKESSIGVCASTGQSSSQLILKLQFPKGIKVSLSTILLEPSHHNCYCISGPMITIGKSFGADLDISHNTLSTLSGNKKISPGRRVFEEW